jgi:hypothetical protein
MPQIVAISIKDGIVEVEKLPKGIELLIRDEDYPKDGDTPDGVDCSRRSVDENGEIIEDVWPGDYCKECMGPKAECKCGK